MREVYISDKYEKYIIDIDEATIMSLEEKRNGYQLRPR